jgi:type II secretory pathway pseudopilin PulG
MKGQAGFSLVEALVAIALVLIVTAVAFALMDPARGAFVTQPEASDMQQRLRVASDTLYEDIVMAGGGVYTGPTSGSLAYFFAPIVPYRTDLNHADPPGTVKSDTISLLYVPSTVAQTTLSTMGPDASVASVGVDAQPGCPVSDQSCGFQAGMAAVIFDASGLHDTFTVSSVSGSTLNLQSTSQALSYTGYPPHSTTIARVVSVVYSLKMDVAAGAFQLVRSLGGAGADQPVVDHIVGLTFDYFGDPQPPRLTGRPLSDPVGPWTTYGPRPPALGAQDPTGGYPAGENCVFLVDPLTGLQAPRLPALNTNGDSIPIQLTAAGFTDGPWCPDDSNANRWDADLLRIRTVGVTLRIQSANAALRGPAGLLFANSGTSTGGSRWLPDLQVAFQVTPRNLNLDR